jgi:SAM-dependent methyltransferase
MPRYTYGDSELAGDRLRLVAELFEPSSEAFLVAAGGSPRLALDLGAGPGETARLIARATGASVVVGVERSAAFAARAARSGVATVVADVAAPFLPIRHADLIYARLLLAHLTDPAAVVARWSTATRVGGRVLVDDLERIETDDAVFREYLDEVALEVVRAEGGALFVGPTLHGGPDPAASRRVHDAVAEFAPPQSATARVFSMNLQVLTERGEVDPRPALAAALRAVADGQRAAEPVRWRVRQLAWERTG